MERVDGVPLLPRERRNQVWRELLQIREVKGGRHSAMALLSVEFGTDDAEVIAKAFRLNWGAR